MRYGEVHPTVAHSSPGIARRRGTPTSICDAYVAPIRAQFRLVDQGVDGVRVATVQYRALSLAAATRVSGRRASRPGSWPSAEWLAFDDSRFTYLWTSPSCSWFTSVPGRLSVLNNGLCVASPV